MKHTINETQYGPRGAAMSQAVESCVHCGFCLAACPTYNVLGEEMDSPRGRIYLMKEVLEENITAAEAEPYIDRCLGCMACQPACPSGVPYGDLLTSYRAFTEVKRSRPLLDTMTRKMMIETLPYPDRFRLAFRTGQLGRLVQSSFIGKYALPEQLGAMLNLLPETLPPPKPLPQVYPAKGERRAKVALLVGCVQTVLEPDINWATLQVLAANGVETVIPAGQGCCGSILMHIGEDQQAQKFSRQNLRVFPEDVDAIITNAAGCGSGMHEYGLLFKGLAEETEAEKFAHKVKDISTFLAELGFHPPEGPQPARRVAYHDACHLAHAQGVIDAPRQLLNSVPNLTLLELNDGGLCCGSAGTYNIEQPEIAQSLGQMKAQRILDTGAECVVSGNIGCLTQIRTHLAEMGQELPIYHTVQVLAGGYDKK